MDTKHPFAIQLDHITAICNAAIARNPRDPSEKMLGRHGAASAPQHLGHPTRSAHMPQWVDPQPYRHSIAG